MIPSMTLAGARNGGPAPYLGVPEMCSEIIAPLPELERQYLMHCVTGFCEATVMVMESRL